MFLLSVLKYTYSRASAEKFQGGEGQRKKVRKIAKKRKKHY